MDRIAATRKLFFDVMKREGLWRTSKSLHTYLTFVFKGISFEGKRVLDIGSGSGIFGFYAAVCGAKCVVCLEPEAHGGSDGMNSQFNRIKEALDLDQVTLLAQTFQEFSAEPNSFDIIILHNSVNHLDEPACIQLGKNPGARTIYKELFDKLAGLATPSSSLVLTDCTSRNLFALLRVKHPLSPSIEWHKHQPPQVWVRLLQSCGFGAPHIRWSSYRRLGTLGWALLANRHAAFFLTGHFCLHMTRK